MSEKRLSNTIFLMYLVTTNYCREHNISADDFLKLDKKYAILNYVAECPDIFDSLTGMWNNMWRSLRTILYHRTASEIQQVDVKLKLGRERKDFGKGFYMAVSKSQAIGMIYIKYREVVRRSKGKLDSAYS